MSSLRQVGSGLLYALISVVLVVGGLSLALAEGGFNSAPAPTQSPASTAAPASTTTAPPSSTAGVQVTDTPSIATATAAASVTSQAVIITATPVTPSATLYVYYPPPPTSTRRYVPPAPCGPFAGWLLSYTVQPGDTLYRIATQYRTTVNAVKTANCKVSDAIFAGERLWVPNVPTITPGVTVIPTFPTSTAVPTEPPTMTSVPTDTETAVPTEPSPPSN